jgi:MFS superfamily sulfate permease-like transporter
VKLFGGLRPPPGGRAFRDVLAGVNLASIDIPQVLGYARIAGMPIVTGLYTVLLPLVAFAIFGSSRHLVVAADSATAAILAGSLSRMAAPASAHYIALVATLALLTSVLLLLARLFKLGFLADFLSRTVLAGFLAGVGVQVCIAMLADMSGSTPQSRFYLVRFWELVRGLGQPHTATLVLSTAVTAVILAGNRLLPRLPLSLVLIVGSILASWRLDFSAHGIATLGAIPGGLPALRFAQVTWSEVLALVPVAGSCFVMIIAQSAATSRAFALRYRESVDTNADILGLAAANAAAAISGAFVVNGSPTQTAVCARVGARSQLAQLVLAAVVAIVLLLLTGPLRYLPRCVLAAIVFTIALGMIDPGRLRDIHRESPGEFYLSIATAVTVVAVGTEQGILLAIALSLFRHVRHSYEPHTMMLVPNGGGLWVPEPAQAGRITAPGLIVYRFGADLFYANQTRFTDEVRALVAKAPTPVRHFIVDAAAITDLDYTAAKGLLDLIDELRVKNIDLLFGRVTYYLRQDLDRHGITAAIGAARVLPSLHEALSVAGVTGETARKAPAG